MHVIPLALYLKLRNDLGSLFRNGTDQSSALSETLDDVMVPLALVLGGAVLLAATLAFGIDDPSILPLD